MTKLFHSTYKVSFTFTLLIVLLNKNYAQDATNIDKRLFVKITLGAGIGTGYPKQNNSFGIAGIGEISLQKQNNFINIGSKGVSEFIIMGSNSVDNSLSTAEITYGRLLQKERFSFIANVGLSYNTFQEQGVIIPRNTGFQIFSSTDYEKINYYAVGVPVSLKLFFNSRKKRGWLFEVFGNINNKIIFGGVNIANQFIVYKTKKEH
jgi:hypothetical protein